MAQGKCSGVSRSLSAVLDMAFITLPTILGSCKGKSVAVTSAEGITMNLFIYILYKDSVHCCPI